jgi:two-component system OmpR family sensor kinase
MTRGESSITGRLIFVLTVGTAILWFISAAISTAILRDRLNANYDHSQAEAAMRLLPLATHSAGEDGRATREVQGNQQFEKEERQHALAYQLRAPDGRVVLRSDDAPTEPFDANPRSGFADTNQYRLFTLIDSRSGLAIQVGQSLAQRQSAILTSTLTLFLPLLLLAPLSAVGIWFAVRRGLRPLTALQAEIAVRGSTNLAPLIVEGLPRELVPIAHALSNLIDRLRRAFEAEREFAANSAHELRTPIAGALAQTQRLIETTADERARVEGRKIAATLRRLADLAEKLMQLARADAGMAMSEEATMIVPVVRLVVADTRSRTRPQRDIELRIATEAENWSAKLNVDALGIVLRNLLDNAVAHSPPETPIEVEVLTDKSFAVRNASPVIDPMTLERLRRRFERGSATVSGTGLGLAIVDTILGQVGGMLSLQSPIQGRRDGFEAVVHLP